MAHQILIVDDEKHLLSSLRTALELEGFWVLTASSGEEALKLLESESVDLVLLDIVMGGMDGIEVLRRVKSLDASVPVVMMSAHGSIETAVKATRLGASDFLEKPLQSERVVVTLRNLLRLARLEEERRRSRGELPGRFGLVGESRAMREVHGKIEAAAPSEGRVLITGESGTGKELVALAIHGESRRSEHPLVTLNCAAVPRELMESELFGHEKGAFTGAERSRRGRFELAHRGTLFLDEVGDMRASMQAKLLRVLESGTVERVGSEKGLPVDVRVIAATHRDLPGMIREGAFREDLYHRLNVIPIHLPPLRVRREDIPHLVRHFLEEISRKNGRRPKTLARGAMARLVEHSWPGNARELANTIERLLILVASDRIEEMDVAGLLGEGATGPVPAGTGAASAEPLTLRERMALAEKEALQAALRRAGGNVSQAARDLGLERSHLHKKLRRHNLK
jgi:two-component system nitrogen regulation response regulator NtrX